MALRCFLRLLAVLATSVESGALAASVNDFGVVSVSGQDSILPESLRAAEAEVETRPFPVGMMLSAWTPVVPLVFLFERDFRDETTPPAAL